jgi:hypothetical protein
MMEVEGVVGHRGVVRSVCNRAWRTSRRLLIKKRRGVSGCTSGMTDAYL